MLMQKLLPDQSFSIFLCQEGVHKDKRDVGGITPVKMIDLKQGG